MAPAIGDLTADTPIGNRIPFIPEEPGLEHESRSASPRRRRCDRRNFA